jgi:hypothetical protein
VRVCVVIHTYSRLLRWWVLRRFCCASDIGILETLTVAVVILQDHPFPADNGTALQTTPDEVTFRHDGLTKWLARGLTYWWFDANWGTPPSIMPANFGHFCHPPPPTFASCPPTSFAEYQDRIVHGSSPYRIFHPTAQCEVRRKK